MEIKKILFLQPPLEANYKHKRIMPLGIGYILAVIRKNFPEIELRFLDMESSDTAIPEGIKIINEYSPDIFLVSYWTPMADAAHEIMRVIRNENNKIKIISGGTHPSIFPEEALKYSDIAVKFEGEITITELIKALLTKSDLSKVAGISYLENGKMIYTGDRDFVEELDSLPFPAWEFMPMENYNTQMHATGGKRMPVMCSRGCPYGCSYCVSPYFWKRKLRWRSYENVVDEIETIGIKLNIYKIHFWDDNLFINPDYIEKLCKEIIRRKLKIEWLGLTRATHIVKCEHLLSLMKSSGCIGMEMGIESADPHSHKTINKEENLETTLHAAELLKKNGMYPMFTYMCLNPGDSLNTYYNQAVFIDKILEGCGWIDFFHPLPVPLYIGQLCTPHPGTKLYEEAEKFGILNTSKWSDYYHHRVNFIPNTLLEDIPVKQTETLTYREILLCVKGMIASKYTFILSDYNIVKRIYIIGEYIKFVRKFYALSLGGYSLREMHKIISESFSVSSDDIYNWLAVTSVILAQIGYIQSKNNNQKFKIREIDISGFGNSLKLARKLHLIEIFHPLTSIIKKIC